jgi:hypothetical protein
MPQPFLGSSLQSVPLAEIARPSRGRLAPLQLSTDVRECTARLPYHLWFPRRPRFHAVAWFPQRL